MKLYALRIVLASALVTLLASSCATTGGGAPSRGAQILRCAATTVGGAVLGAAIDKKNGAKVGGALGLAACMVWLAFDNAADKQRLREASAKAAASGKPLEQEWTDEQSRKKAISIMPGEKQTVQRTTGAPLICRTMKITLTANGDSSGPAEQEWCRGPDGSYKPRSEFSVA